MITNLFANTGVGGPITPLERGDPPVIDGHNDELGLSVKVGVVPISEPSDEAAT